MITNFTLGCLYKSKKNGFILCPICNSGSTHLDSVIYEIGGGWFFESCLVSRSERDDIFDCAFSVASGSNLIFSAGDVLSEQEMTLFRCRLDMAPIVRER